MLFSFCSSRDGASSICCIARPLIAVLKVRSRRRTFSRARSLLSPSLPLSLSRPFSLSLSLALSLSLSLSLSLFLSRRVRARTPVHAACAVQGRARLYACLFLLLFREPWLYRLLIRDRRRTDRWRASRGKLNGSNFVIYIGICKYRRHARRCRYIVRRI